MRSPEQQARDAANLDELRAVVARDRLRVPDFGAAANQGNPSHDRYAD